MNGIIILIICIGMGWLNRRLAPVLTLANYQNDRSLSGAFGMICLAGMVIAGFFSNVASLPRIGTSAILCVTGTLIGLKALHDNPFFAPDIVAPPYRISDGLYAQLEHPGYFGFSMRFLGMAFLVNTTASFLIFCAYTAFLAERVIRENRLLRGV